ncbi:hypothetical protein D6853_04195 [Butyrivibrio sp. X503]|uniref:DUF6115 domain-containing protein n=1 Tax=Butyrivibrio sp. X503 TaxID=2364878 RepID=UPI000EAA8EF0|nr:DUF6115 domain-containing protein [Butyrivibrio sp. X503]RKM57224.1 hypothetical protein D6853_04195 [Butyrivibrio sp. X503]
MISITEIVLIIAGFAAIILGYLLPAGKEMDEEDKMLMEREIRELVRREVEEQKETIENMVDDTVEDSLGRTERAMERISNEKLSAINEYSDTVISDIHKNHDEVMFMYDMLNDKHKNLTSVVSEVTRKADEAKQVVRDAEATVKEAKEASSSLKDIHANEIPKNEVPEPIVRKVPEEVPVADLALSSKNDVHQASRLEDIKATVIKPDESSNLHIIGNDNKDASDKSVEEHKVVTPDKSIEDSKVVTPVSNKVVPITEAVRVEGRSANPDKNMRELTANDPISQNRQIIEMHKAGKSNMVIARELGLGIGEVKLVIDLSNKHRKVK